jgi:hypothetical protein
MVDMYDRNNPLKMPPHFFYGALHVDYTTAIRADISKQDYSICPRFWYIDAAFACGRCGKNFVFSADEQRFWYEEAGFYVDSFPRQCRECRRELRELKSLRQEYNRDIAAALAGRSDLAKKQRLIDVVRALENGGVQLPEKVLEHCRLLQQQIERAASSK